MLHLNTITPLPTHHPWGSPEGVSITIPYVRSIISTSVTIQQSRTGSSLGLTCPKSTTDIAQRTISKGVVEVGM